MKYIFLTVLSLALVYGKVYDRCELARELLTVHRAPSHQIPIWVCIAEHESQYMTHVVGNLSVDGSNDHGLFQINDRYWCSPPGEGQGCGLSCSKLQDDDISDDFKCVQKIYKEHKKLQGDGFNAWAVYQSHCRGSKAEKYVKNCFDDSLEPFSYNEVNSGPSYDFINATAKNGYFAFPQDVAFDAFFTPKTSAPLSSFNYLTTSKPTTVNYNKEFKPNQFLYNSLQPSSPASENTAIKFSKPLTKLYHSKGTSTTSQFPYINRLAFFNPTTIKGFSTISTVSTPIKYSASQFRPLPTIRTVKTPLAFSSSQFSSFSRSNDIRSPSVFSASQFRPAPTVSTVSTRLPIQTSNQFHIVNAARFSSKPPSSNFRPFYSTTTLRPTSKSFFAPPSPTVSSFFRPSTTISAKSTSHKPVFIVNGAKWY